MREPTQERGRVRVEAILAAAAEIVAQSGVHAVTTTEVAKTAQVPVGSIYQFFEGAPDILQVLQWRLGAEIVAHCRAAIDAAPEGLGWREVNHLSLRTYWDGLLARPVYIALQREATLTQSFSQSISTGESDIGDLFRHG
ncbi:MAG: TetR family transcriptional regulator, partial [Parvibaculum sp.]